MLPRVARAELGQPLTGAPANAGNPTVEIEPTSLLNGNGIQVGEGTSIYPQVGIEAGFNSNLFYASSNPVSAGLIDAIFEIGVGSLSNQRLEQKPSDEHAEQPTSAGDFQYSINAFASYVAYLSDNHDVTSLDGLSLGAVIKGIVKPMHPVSFQFNDIYSRYLRATNFESNRNTNQDIDYLTMQLNYQPQASSLSAALHYATMIDLFEQQENRFADRWLNEIGVRLNYKFFPQTQLYVDVSEGYDTGVGSESIKSTSYPLTAVLGFDTSLTVNTSINARVGYENGFYSDGPSYGSVLGGVYIEHRWATGKAGLMYTYDHYDSINANFYSDQLIQLWLEEHVAPFVLFVSPNIRFRTYEGTIVTPTGAPATSTDSERDDTIFAVYAGAMYQFRQSMMASLEYRLTVDSTDFRYMSGAETVDPSYTLHEIYASFRWMY